jgi:hypothetical protein
MRAKRKRGKIKIVDTGFPATISKPTPLLELPGFSGGGAAGAGIFPFRKGRKTPTGGVRLAPDPRTRRFLKFPHSLLS